MSDAQVQQHAASVGTNCSGKSINFTAVPCISITCSILRCGHALRCPLLCEDREGHDRGEGVEKVMSSHR
jgi:hypothetical protein